MEDDKYVRLTAENVSLQWEQSVPPTFLHPKDIPKAIAMGTIHDGQVLPLAKISRRTWELHSKFSNQRKEFRLHATHDVNVKLKRKGERCC